MGVSAVLAAMLGLLLGAFVNVLVVRIPREGRFGGWPRCTRCGRPLAFWQVVPLIGWLAQGGRARCCGKSLHWVFPAVELALAVALGVFGWRYGFSVTFWYLAFVAVVLVLTAAIDWLHRFIYTLFILVPALVAILASWVLPTYGPLNAIIGALAGGIAFVLLFLLGRVMFPSASVPFGLGDVYLAIFIGAAVGITNLMAALFVGMLLAGVYSAAILLGRRGGAAGPQYISYGSFLCVGVLIYLVAGLAGF